ncbi:GRAM domain-containing protein 2B-like isoform X2 [Drosophila hydei]|uniref:GRAM domain-containing protein 2B-like isoform X2 n=1 Tax=Drosophila hydei TaxID=7224 RepID=A0A6J1LQD4_DROHY|nr:GRAM domain-containing protein 2B-like isoform X2 [Drosophila hydei]
MATITEEEVNGNGKVDSSMEPDSTLQQLKAKKNKSNLFLIKSYSFIEKNNNNSNRNINNNNNHKINNNHAQYKRLQSPDMEPFPDIASLMLVADDQPAKKTRQKKSQKKQKSKALKNTEKKLEVDQQDQQFISEQEAQLLRRNPHEYEELFKHSPATHGCHLPRPQSLPGKVHFEASALCIIESQSSKHRSGNIKRESFLRQSLQSIRRSFGSNKHASKLSIATPTSTPLPSPVSSNASSTSSCSSATAISMLSKAQAHNHILDEFLPTPVVLLLNNDAQIQYLSQTVSSSLPQSFSSYNGPLQSSGSAHSLGSSSTPSPRNRQSPTQGQGKASGNTAKQHELQQASAVAAISSTSAAAGAGSGVASSSTAAGSATVTATPTEKEKKRKEVSSSRVKKFHRHFSQVSKDEKLINYFSCALVGDIPLQGHLYITDEHFAFYSNVFGYVTKVVIPTSSVTKISKEKTVKIIPNAVGVATADERHVFGSFISRESAFRLMCNVCSHLATGPEILPKPLPVDVELQEEYLLDDDSSCSVSGNESPPHLRDPAAAAAAAIESEPQMLLRQRGGSDRHPDLQAKSSLAVSHSPVTIRSSAPPIVHYEEPIAGAQVLLIQNGAGSRSINGSASTSATASAASSSGPPSSSSSPITVVGVTAPTPTVAASPSLGRRLSGLAHSARAHLGLRLPSLTELHVIYLGIMLALMLALFSVFLLYRILDIEAKTSLYRTPVDFNLRPGNDEDIFAEALRWQKELQDKSTAEAQNILTRNLEQISKVRRSLETLSMLIHDRRAGYGESQAGAGPESVSEIGAMPEPDLV